MRAMMKMPTKRLRSLATRWCKCTSGGSTVELAILVPVLTLLAVGGFDFGRLALHKLAATNAARAGAQYGTLDFATAADISGIVQAARDDAEDTNNELNVNARQFCFCPGQGELACTAACADGSFSMMYVEVTVQEPYEYLMNYPGLTLPDSVESTIRMRVR